MRSDIVPGAIFPDYELSDHTAKRRKLSELQGQHPMVLVLSRGGFCPKDRRRLRGLLNFIASSRLPIVGLSQLAPTISLRRMNIAAESALSTGTPEPRR
jgi:peroxiredoxin